MTLLKAYLEEATMLNHIHTFLMGMGAMLLLSACSSPTVVPDVVTRSLPTQPTTILLLPATLEPSPTSPIIPNPTETAFMVSSPETVTSELSPVPSTTPIAISTELPLVKTVSCQDLPENNSHPLVGTGYVLYYTSGASELKAVSLDDFGQQRLLERFGKSLVDPQLSPGGDTIAFLDYPEELVLYDLMTDMTKPIPWKENWVLAYPHWSQDEHLVIIDRTTDQRNSLDPLTQNVEKKEKPPQWPKVYYHTIHGVPGSGFITTDPTETFAVYTEQRVEPNHEINYVLRNVQDGHEIWHTDDTGNEYYVKPIWDEADKQFLLVLPKTENRDYTFVFGLTPVGQEIEIARISQLPSVGADFEIRYLELSHDQRYIHFGLLETIETGSGYILDTHTHTIYEICEPNFVQGWWLPGEEGGHLMYLVDKENGERVLKLLDVTTWQDGELLVTDKNFNARNVIGWTSIETPQ